jgi:hypothetical protein
MATAVLPRASAREADWRFLLPQSDAGMFEHMLLAGGSPDLGAYVAGLGIARRVSQGPGGGPAADVVVLLSDADVSLDELAPHIAESACVYIEVDRRAPGRHLLTPRRLTRALEAHGFDATGAYWVKPGFPRRDMYLPFGRKGALRWYLETEYRATSPARRVLKKAMYALAQREGAFAAVAPCYAMTAVRGLSHRLPALVEQVCTPHDGTTDALLLAAGEADWNRLVFLLFNRDAQRPSAAVKIPRSTAFNSAVSREHSTLRDVTAALPPWLLSTIPSSMLMQVGGVSVTAETCVRGASLATTAGPGVESALDDLHGAATWLAKFHRETTRGHVAAAEWVEQELIGRLCAEYKTVFGLTAAERRLFDAALNSVGDDADDLPIVWHHADFGPWNIYRDGDHVSVIDWETARRGPALADLLFFALHWSAALHGCESATERVRHFTPLFCGARRTGTINQAIDRELLDYMRAVGVPAPLLPHVLLYMVVEQAIIRARRLETAGRAVLRDAAANEYLGCIDALARHAHVLFPYTRSERSLYAAS